MQCLRQNPPYSSSRNTLSTGCAHASSALINIFYMNNCISLVKFTADIEWYTLTLDKPRASVSIATKVVAGQSC